MKATVIFILVSMFGAFCQEVVHWFELRNKTQTKEFKAMMNSKFYWIITAIMILISGIGTWLLFAREIPDQRNIQFILGAAFPIIFKKLVQAYERRDLGGKVTSNKDAKNIGFKAVAKQYFK